MRNILKTTSLFISCIAMLFALVGCSSLPALNTSGKFQIGLMGDQHYDAKSSAQFPNIMADMNRADLAFVVHVGDIGSPNFGSCKDETFYKRRDEFNQSRHPLIFTPGDNEWTDCHEAGIPDSLERLSKVREVFFQNDQTLGKRTFSLDQQSNDSRYTKYRENARWVIGNVVFVTLHIPGSNNNFGRTPQMDAEYVERNAANLAWMKQSFDYAKKNNNLGMMILIQGNPQFQDTWPQRRSSVLSLAPPSKKVSGYAEFLSSLQNEVLAYNKPIALVHGDSHYFRVDKPLIVNDKSGAGRGRVIENFTRVELFGYPEAHWVRATVDPSDPNLFSFQPAMVKENFGSLWSK
jgi:hypothetical protein